MQESNYDRKCEYTPPAVLRLGTSAMTAGGMASNAETERATDNAFDNVVSSS